jgi:TolB protein
VYASTQHHPTADIYIKSVDGRTVTQLTSDPAQDVMPKISPDGQRVAFASNRSGNWDIYVMPVSGGKAAQITSEPSQDLHASWSPDGTQLVFSRLGQTSGKWEMWVTDVGNSAVSRFIGYGLFPEWCPVAGTGLAGGDRILFQRSRERGDRAFGIWAVDFKDGQASNPTEIATSTTGACINPTWSPDGRWIVYATVPAAPTSPGHDTYAATGKPASSDLWMISVDGTERVNLVSGRGANLMPCWASNDRIFFVSDRGGTDNLWSLNASGAILAATGRTAGPGANTGAAHAPEAHAPEGVVVGEHGH